MLPIVKRRILFLLISIFIIFLSGCMNRPEPNLRQRLEAKGVRVIHVGETIRLVLSSEFLFMPNSANIQRCQFAVLDEVARFLRRFQKVVILVAAYTTPSHDPAYDNALTRQQAYNVVTYLWNQKVDARMMEGIGYGSQCPLSGQCSLNRRVEIIFHYIPDYLHEMVDPEKQPAREVLP